jgi:hypothetical protein
VRKYEATLTTSPAASKLVKKITDLLLAIGVACACFALRVIMQARTGTRPLSRAAPGRVHGGDSLHLWAAHKNHV